MGDRDPQPSSANELAQIADCVAKGRLRDASILCRALIRGDPFNVAGHIALADIASRLRRFDVAIESYSTALRLDPRNQDALRGAEKARAEAARQGTAAVTAPGYLLIKAWGAGFWSDMDHVIGSLLAAELTHRTPIVHWGAGSLFCPPGTANAWPLYFEPVSAVSLESIRAASPSCFPPKWSGDNLGEDNVDKWQGSGSRVSALEFFNRPETMVVADFFDRVSDLMPWMPANSPYRGLSRTALYRTMVSRHIKLRGELAGAIDRFWAQRMAQKRWLAVHMRGTDKIGEEQRLGAVNDEYIPATGALLAQEPNLGIFLITDSIPLLDKMRSAFGDRILATDSIRSSGTIGIHFSNAPPEILAREVIADTYLAARCDYFLGNGASNVSMAVEYLKDWNPGTYHLLGRDLRHVQHMFPELPGTNAPQ